MKSPILTIFTLLGIVFFFVGILLFLMLNQKGNVSISRLACILGGLGFVLIVFAQAVRMFNK